MNEQLKIFLDFIDSAIQDIQLQRKISFELNCNEITINLLDNSIILAKTLKQKSIEGDLKLNYLNQFRTDITNIVNQLSFRGHANSDFLSHQDSVWKETVRKQIETNSIHIRIAYEQISFNLDFFNKIGFFNSNVVAIGANGSGKTSLSDKFKIYLQNNGVVISAQRILLVPNFNSISNPANTASELKQSQTINKKNKSEGEFRHLQQEFAVILKNLLAENISAGNNYRKESLEKSKRGEELIEPEATKLDKAFSIWNSLIEHRVIECNDGMNITATYNGGNSYPLIQMSDGEKVMLYLIGQVLQSPTNGFIVVDEPEMYLHKTVLKKLWDLLEKERNDCLFIYLTHDLDFATSRTTAKKIWIKSFKHPNIWEIEDILSDEIPETLLFELLGSRKNILFCEGLKGKIDESVFSILFPELTITPVGSCFDVINHTKAFNKLKNVNTKAYGLIDADHHSFKRLEKLKLDNIYNFNVAEIENLFLDEDFLLIMAEQLLVDMAKVEFVKNDIMKELDRMKEEQAANYVSTKVNYFFTDSDVSKGNELRQLKENYQTFLDKISISEWYEKRLDELMKIIQDSDYSKAIIVFNNKGIKNIVSRHFGISNFQERSLKVLQNNPNALEKLVLYFPIEIKTAGNIG